MKKMVGGVGLAAAAMLLAANPAPAQANQTAKQNHEVRGITPDRKSARYQIQNTIGGIPTISFGGIPGLSPKEYGIRFGNGKSRKGKTNMLHVSRKAKMRG